MLKSVIKEIIILLLLSVAILLILMVLFYDYIPISEEIPTVQAYTTPEDVRNELDTTISEAEKVEVTYEVTDSDLNVYQQTGRYNEGKANPFSLQEENVNETTGNGFIEIKNAETDKGNIYDILRKKYDVKKILAIGDNDNDKELFEKADISVAVANSSTLAITTAQYLCENECAKGFLDMLETVKNAKWYYREEI